MLAGPPSPYKFLSTPSARRATRTWSGWFPAGSYFYPRPPRGGRHHKTGEVDYYDKISIHALREEGDRNAPKEREDQQYFYPRPPRGGRQRAAVAVLIAPIFLSTPSARRATRHRPLFLCGGVISIHTLREEGDPPLTPALAMVANFYPRPPRGGRQLFTSRWAIFWIFLSTPSARRATVSPSRPAQAGAISIHALREEGDRRRRRTRQAFGQFLSTPSARRATSCRAFFMTATTNFYPRPPRGGRRTSTARRRRRP